ncbi:hypothetical protein K469DRAFT_690874 [Zopfia rhizophila CBS 207.26]|uniref:Uncharacterized protein n=1 Tax=Zopfia rhizophila CBS 207.26 TaxID=1314779 RepID=A0A6A6DTM1_9PEZI|nr:hypothetical protein K469DRAFT_690874 [Zopfia rhizophila CBS 207.26]
MTSQMKTLEKDERSINSGVHGSDAPIMRDRNQSTSQKNSQGPVTLPVGVRSSPNEPTKKEPKAIKHAVNNHLLATTTPDCPYHAPVLQLTPRAPPAPQQLCPLERFINTLPSEQSAIFLCPDDGGVSISKDCTCGQVSQEVIDASTYASCRELGAMTGTQFEDLMSGEPSPN